MLVLLLLSQLSVILPALIFCRYSQNDLPVDRRSRSQWLRSIAAYLEYKTGDSWRRLSDPAQRWDPDRLWYLNGIDLMHTFLADTSGEILLALPSPRNSPCLVDLTDELRARSLARSSRAELVGWLMDVDPKLTDHKLLMGLSRLKLARMLIKQRDANAAAVEALAVERIA